MTINLGSPVSHHSRKLNAKTSNNSLSEKKGIQLEIFH